jgi:hypothetical protein
MQYPTWILVAAALFAGPGLLRLSATDRPRPTLYRRLIGRCSPVRAGIESVDPIARGFYARIRPHVER